MSYHQHADGKITLTMTKSDYQFLLVALGMAMGSKIHTPTERNLFLGLINRLNEGNPDFVAYAIPTEAAQ